MRRFFRTLFKKVAEILEDDELQTAPVEVVLDKKSIVYADFSNDGLAPKAKKTQGNKVKKTETDVISYLELNDPMRDVIDLMEFPFLALSKDRKNPIIYESADGTTQIKVTRHTGHFLASIYDWDIILVVAGKIQEIINKGSDIPPRKITIPRHEILKALHKQDGKKERKDLEKSLDRLKLTGISTTVNNKDLRYRAGFGFLDSWGYLERKSNREMRIIRITLSDWLYDLCCAQGSLLKPSRFYFDISSGLKKFLYRTARKHAGNNRDGWEFSLEKLYEKSGSEGNIRKFKSKLKAAVVENKLPDYSMEWIDRRGKTFIGFKKRSLIDEIDEVIEKHEEKQGKMIEFNETRNFP